MTVLNLFEQAAECLAICDPRQKVQRTQLLYAQWCEGKLDISAAPEVDVIGEAGRPERPELVAPRDVPKRSMNTPEGRVVLCHALAHIEFNAINLALDALYRFRDMPVQYYGDWLKVASEEAYHFTLLESYLREHQSEYGDYAGHNGLWHMAQITADDVMVRMALVPRVLEARGLDVTPGIIQKLEQAKDRALIAHLNIIYRDEISHVAIGSHWFKFICEQRKLNYRTTFKDLILQYMQGKLRGPFDDVARMQAGFSAEEMADLNAMNI
ncbi:FIG00005326: uncharacterized protein [hydrothermal vent metagenome]|uniref:FIG00005326: uncharacterized protein n=1 Tax=hydrothermal vent metagenome TaxID=652676 RepID=A0A3B0XI21_9ZZZZ